MSDSTSLGIWQGKEENYLLWETVDQNNRGFITAGWLDNGHWTYATPSSSGLHPLILISTSDRSI